MAHPGFNAPLAEALTTQGRVILALMLREARTRYGRLQVGYLWALIEPIIHIVFFMVFFYFISRVPPLGDSMALFLATGMATFLGFRNVMSRTQGGYGSNVALLSFPVVKVMDVFVARALLELATWIVVTYILLGSLIAIGYGPLPRNGLMMLAAVLELCAIGFGLGVFFGILAEFMPSLNRILKFPLRFLYFTSGIFFLPDDMVPQIRDLIAWNPILHGITQFRIGYYPSYESHMFDPQYLFGWAVGSVLLAAVLERALRKNLRNLN